MDTHIAGQVNTGVQQVLTTLAAMRSEQGAKIDVLRSELSAKIGEQVATQTAATAVTRGQLDALIEHETPLPLWAVATVTAFWTAAATVLVVSALKVWRII